MVQSYYGRLEKHQMLVETTNGQLCIKETMELSIYFSPSKIEGKY